MTRITPVLERVRLLVHRWGYDVHRDPFRHRFVPTLRERGIDAVLDIGANHGQFGAELRLAGYSGRIISVEPLPETFEVLQRRTTGDHAWTACRSAVSERPGTVTLNVSANTVSSSVLPILDVHTLAAPSSQYVASEEVASTTIDALMAEHGLVPSSTLCKIDVQGYEHAVLDGASGTLPTLGGIRTELSLVPLYEGQLLMADMVDRLGSEGLELWMLDPGFVDPDSNRLLQLDGTFFRT